jgi:hypothetical protein
MRRILCYATKEKENTNSQHKSVKPENNQNE